ncbi:uncharacterized protein LOC121999813 [Zingiber officinale]|uniref:Uncharacterized protein n=1 Tax=Zingiber officinale TaxID=94328 RepID=A0A8J5G202_ZINOF|nr:uncharacterized protein LOC121999813 [Zingiber officinale]KAG6494547.1 hypothetical protein ZIOFF_049587 [Zingiber officinale]
MVSSGAKQLSPSSCSPSRRSKRRLHRFLKPGDLARLRDSIFRTVRSDAPLLLSPPSSPSPAAQIDGRPCFVARGHGPRYPQRRKLVAAKYVFFGPPSPDPEHFFDPFGVDLVPAH